MTELCYSSSLLEENTTRAMYGGIQEMIVLIKSIKLLFLFADDHSDDGKNPSAAFFNDSISAANGTVATKS